MRLLITGGAGCLGSNIIERYLPAGHEICVIDNYATGKRETLPRVAGLSVFEGSVADRDILRSCFDALGPTHVIHSAAAYKDPDDWEEDAITNVIGAINVAELSAEYGVSKVINFQTALCYGNATQSPIRSDSPSAPFTSYGISKVAGEQYLVNSDCAVVSLRLANICGPRLAIGPIPTFYQRLSAGKACFCSDTVRDFLDYEDFLDLLDLVLADDAHTGVFNASTGEGHSIFDIFQIVADYLEITDRDVPIVPPGDDDAQSVVLDSSCAERAFGWKAKKSFEQTIIRQLDWYKAYGVSEVHSHLKASGK